MPHTFFVNFFAVVLHDYNVKLQKFLSYTFFGGNVVRVARSLFFTAAHFHLAFLMLSSPLQNFHVVLPTKKCLLLSKITSSRIWVATLVDWVILHWYESGVAGRSEAVRVPSRDYQIFWDGYIYLPMVILRRALRARESSVKKVISNKIFTVAVNYYYYYYYWIKAANLWYSKPISAVFIDCLAFLSA